jgi:hypothetical protein
MTVRLDVDSTGFTVRLSGLDVVAGGRRELFVPYERVLGARVMTRTDALASSPRLAAPALWWPRRLRLGCWGIGERRQFWGVHDGAHLVVVYLSGRPFHRVVLDVDEPHLTHRRIDAALLRSKQLGARRSIRDRAAARSRAGTHAPRREGGCP